MQIESWVDEILNRFETIAMKAFQRVTPEEKQDGSVVTRIDKETSEIVREAIFKHSMEDGLISEEEPEAIRPDAKRVWVLDPIDGTASFARGYPVWGLGLGLLQDGKPTKGYMSFPAIGQRYICINGEMFINGKRHTPPKEPNFKDIQNVLVGSTAHNDIQFDALKGIKLRNFGSHLFHVLSVGLGRAEAAIAQPCALWDIAAALPFTRSRGCIERYMDGREFVPGDLLTPNSGHKTKVPLIIGTPHQVEDILSRLA